jgi:hypothetical protein
VIVTVAGATFATSQRTIADLRTLAEQAWTSVPLLPKVPDAGAVDAARELATP